MNTLAYFNFMVAITILILAVYAIRKLPRRYTEILIGDVLLVAIYLLFISNHIVYQNLEYGISFTGVWHLFDLMVLVQLGRHIRQQMVRQHNL